MYITDVIWWGYTAFMTAVALFMLYFARKVQQTCPESKRRKGGGWPFATTSSGVSSRRCMSRMRSDADGC